MQQQNLVYTGRRDMNIVNSRCKITDRNKQAVAGRNGVV